MLLFRKSDKYSTLLKARSHKYVWRESDGNGGWKYFYSKKPGEGRIAINYNDVRDFGYEKAVEILSISENIRKEKNEHSITFDTKGQILLHKIGDNREINYTNKELKIITNARLLLHNHPSGDSFSFKDIGLLFVRNIKEIRACGAVGKIKIDFSLTQKKPVSISLLQEMISMLKSSRNTYYVLGNRLPAHMAMIDVTTKYGDYIHYEHSGK